MNRKKVTSTDVAKKAGVSQSAVSMILNKKYNVSFSRETIERVEELPGFWDIPMRRKIRKQEYP